MASASDKPASLATTVFAAIDAIEIQTPYARFQCSEEHGTTKTGAFVSRSGPADKLWHCQVRVTRSTTIFNQIGGSYGFPTPTAEELRVGMILASKLPKDRTYHVRLQFGPYHACKNNGSVHEKHPILLESECKGCVQRTVLLPSELAYSDERPWLVTIHLGNADEVASPFECSKAKAHAEADKAASLADAKADIAAKAAAENSSD